MPAGRPPIFKNPEDMQKVIDLYFLACKVHQLGDEKFLLDLDDESLKIINDIEDTVPTVSGLAYTLGMTTEAFRNYGTQEEFSATVKRAKQRIEISLEQRLAGNAVTGAIFNLKNNFGWKDQQDHKLSGSFSVTVPDDDAGTL